GPASSRTPLAGAAVVRAPGGTGTRAGRLRRAIRTGRLAGSVALIGRALQAAARRFTLTLAGRAAGLCARASPGGSIAPSRDVVGVRGGALAARGAAVLAPGPLAPCTVAARRPRRVAGRALALAAVALAAGAGSAPAPLLRAVGI